MYEADHEMVWLCWSKVLNVNVLPEAMELWLIKTIVFEIKKKSQYNIHPSIHPSSQLTSGKNKSYSNIK